jgi:hypothetical protein
VFWASANQEELVTGVWAGYKESTMNNSAAKSVWVVVLAILFGSSNILFAGSELSSGDGKDDSKEVVPVEKSWCETPS